MSIDGGHRKHIPVATALSRIIIVARGGTLFQSLARVIDDQTGSCSTVVCDSPARVDAEEPIQLILLHGRTAPDMANLVETWRAIQPDASIAILVDDMQDLPAGCDQLFANQQIHGVLPLTLKLEVWLAAVSLLLSGGEYYPAAGRREMPVGIPPARRADDGASWSASRSAAGTMQRTDLPPLTTREQQILELVSEGHQNKLIAHKMSLSEHTVKVHVHNLLSKLRVSNRTQAAAAFRNGLTGPLRTTALMKAREATANRPVATH